VVAPYRARTGFANRPLALRRCLVEILRRRDRLTAADMAAIAYARRIVVRPGHRRHVVPNAQLVAVRRALRKLVDKGRVEVLYRYRRRKIFVLRQEVEQ
jgi:hypothetical protein